MNTRSASRARLALAVAGACFLATACFAPPVESPQTHVTQETPIRVPQSPRKVDVLFMIDNSPSMDAMQKELQARFGDFLSVFDTLAKSGVYPDLHIGVVTSDYGAGDTSKKGGCDASPGGQRGLLQAVGAKAPAGCVGPSGTPFVSYAYGPEGATHNLPPGQTLQQTFTCMASVGSDGCGFEHQLESVYAALHNSVENATFLRDDALLAVVFVTNEDDGSAPPTTRIYEDDGGAGGHGAYDTYRQTRYGITCGDPSQPPPYGDSTGPLASCVPAVGGEQYDVSRYIEMFTEPPRRHGIKRSKEDVILVGLDGPVSPVSIIQAQRQSGSGVAPQPTYVSCGPGIDSSCLVRLQHSCQNRAQPAFFADPPVRLNAVITQSPNHQISSICGDDLDHAPDFSKALASVADAISRLLSPGCIPAQLTNSAYPDCVVEDVRTDDDGSDHVTELPRCDLAMGQFPCWRVEDKAACANLSPQSLGVTIDRGGWDAPADTTARVYCSTLAN